GRPPAIRWDGPRILEADGGCRLQDGRSPDGARPLPRLQLAEDTWERDVGLFCRQWRPRSTQEDQRRQDVRGLDEISVARPPRDPAAGHGDRPRGRRDPASGETDPRPVRARIRAFEGGVMWAS